MTCIDIRPSPAVDFGAVQKNQHIQIRLSDFEKAYIARQASKLGVDMSTWVRRQLFERSAEPFLERARQVLDSNENKAALSELNDFLFELPSKDFSESVREFPGDIDAENFWANYIAAMVEVAAHQKQVAPPAWTSRFKGLGSPHFVTPLKSLRLHLLHHSPPPFKRRNIFVDSSVGDRV